MTLKQLAKSIKDAKCPEDVFGANPAKSFKMLSRDTHPDLNPTNVREATEAFHEVQRMWKLAKDKIDAGTYGDKKPIIKLTVTWKGGKLSILEVLRNNGMFKHLLAKDDNHSRLRIVKVASKNYRSFADNEILVLKRLLQERPVTKGEYSPFPHLLTSFQFPVGKGVRMPALVLLEPVPEDLVTLETVIKAYPDGLDPRDMIWMLNKLLIICQIATDAGLVHGGLNPSNVWVSPKYHLGYVDGWHFATGVKSKVAAMDPKYVSYVAPEIANKEPVGPTTDLYSCCRLACALLSGNRPISIPLTTPRAIAGLLRAGLLQNQKQRPYDNTAQLYNELEQVFAKIYGPKQFRPFSLTQ